MRALAGDVPPELKTVSTLFPPFRALAGHGRPWETSEDGGDLPSKAGLASLRLDCLVPILGRDNRLGGVVVLGPRLSEEPYSGFRRGQAPAASIAAQAGIALESSRLGETVAERIEAEHRAAQEMEFAPQVQSRLFPKSSPP